MTGFQDSQGCDWVGLPDRVRRFICDEHLIPTGCQVLAAVSGGADSLALLLILQALQQDMAFSLNCVHIHHGLRGAAADADLASVRDWCRRLAVPFCSREIPVSLLAAEQGIGLELAARNLRREVFSRLADELSRQPDGTRRKVFLALAHHLDDQAETLLLHLGRGAGLDGLTGMKPADGLFIRPLLTCRRSEIEAWLTSRQINWCHDRTNDDDFTVRNRLRHRVLPQWHQALGYDPTPLLCRTAENLALDRSFLDLEAQAAYCRCRRDSCLDKDDLLAQHPAIQVRVLGLFWKEQTGHGQNLEKVHIRSILSWLPNASSGQSLDLPDHRCIRYREGRVRMTDRNSPAGDNEPKFSEPVSLAIPGVTRIEELNLQICAEFIENADEIVYNGAVECFWLDRIRHCVLRTRLAGDRIHPWGRTGGKSLKKYLQEQQVPPNRRSGLLVLACGREVAWLPGYVSGAGFVARSDDGCSGPIIRLQLQPLSRKTVTGELADATDIG